MNKEDLELAVKDNYYTSQEIITELEEEIQQLEKQLENLRSGEYYKQLYFEINMLKDFMCSGEVSKEDKKFIDMTHRNTELKQEKHNLIKYLEDKIKLYSHEHIVADMSTSYDLNEEIRKIYQDILEKVKSGKYE